MKYVKHLACCALAAASMILVSGCTTMAPAPTKPPAATASTASATRITTPVPVVSKPPASPTATTSARPSATARVKHIDGVVRTGNLIDVTDVGGASFATPSGNIVCDLYTPSADGFHSTEVRCDIQAFTFTPPPKPADCPLDWGQSLILRTAATFGCIGDTAVDAASTTGTRVSWWDRSVDGTATTGTGVSAALAYGRTMTAGDLSCTSTTAGVTCRNTRTHGQFFLSRDRYALSN